MSVIRVTKKFLSILSNRQKIRVLELTILMLFGGILEIFSVALVLPFMNAVMNPEEAMDKWYFAMVCDSLHIYDPRVLLMMVAIGMAIAYLVKNIYLIFEYNVQFRFVYENMFTAQSKLLDNYIHRPYEYFLKVESGEIVRVINSDTSTAFELLSTLIGFYTELIVSGMLIVAVAFIAPIPTMCMAVVLLFLLLVIAKVIKPILQKEGKRNQKSVAGMNKWLLQSIQGIKELKILNKEDYFLENFNENGRGFVSAIRKAKTLSIMPRFFIEAVCMSSMFVVVAVMIYSGQNLENIIPMLSAVAMAAVRLLPSTNRISNSVAQIAYSETMLDKTIENIQASSENRGKNVPHGKNDFSIGTLHDEIAFDAITFGYPGTDMDVLSEASFKIKKGEAIGIVGGSGSGKTTAVDILLGLLKPQKGKILIDGNDIETDITGWHDCIGYIPQTIFMLDDTIRRNVSFGVLDKDVDEGKVWKTLQQASLDEFVKSLPEGLDTRIGERGVRLSGGQRQRIGIARALYRDPSILVFDEATSALDNETEAAIMESINRLQGEKTMVIIAHRLSTIQNCDHIFRVERGNIVKER